MGAKKGRERQRKSTHARTRARAHTNTHTTHHMTHNSDQTCRFVVKKFTHACQCRNRQHFIIDLRCLTGERLKSLIFELTSLGTYEAAMVSIESGSAGGQ